MDIAIQLAGDPYVRATLDLNFVCVDNDCVRQTQEFMMTNLADSEDVRFPWTANLLLANSNATHA